MRPIITATPRSDGKARLGTRLAALAVLFLLAGCHGGTLDEIYPGTLGHDPPPAVNLPPQDQGMGLIAPPAESHR